MVNRIIVFIFIILMFSKCYGFSLINKLKMPPNATYFTKFNIKLNKFINEQLEKQKQNQANTKEKVDFSEIFKLTGIIKIDNNFFAIINGETYEKGAIINGFKILSINIYNVLLSNLINNEKVVLKIEN